jgi:hypothetical protein
MYHGRYSREGRRWVVVWPSTSNIVSASHGLVPDALDQDGGKAPALVNDVEQDFPQSEPTTKAPANWGDARDKS